KRLAVVEPTSTGVAGCPETAWKASGVRFGRSESAIEDGASGLTVVTALNSLQSCKGFPETEQSPAKLPSGPRTKSGGVFWKSEIPRTICVRVGISGQEGAPTRSQTC